MLKIIVPPCCELLQPEGPLGGVRRRARGLLRCRAEGCTQLERGAVLPGAGRGQGLKAEVAAGSQQCVCVCVHVVGAAPRVHGDVWLSLRCVSCCAGRACAAPLGWMGGEGGGGLLWILQDFLTDCRFPSS